MGCVLVLSMVRNTHAHVHICTSIGEMMCSLKILEVSIIRFYMVNPWENGNENPCDNCYMYFPCLDDMSLTG